MFWVKRTLRVDVVYEYNELMTVDGFYRPIKNKT